MQRTPPPRYRPPLKPPKQAERSDSNFAGRCPHLGTAADSGTALAFASDANQCYRTRLPVPISVVHQQNFCLTADFAQCPVYQQNLHFAEVAPLVTAAPSWIVADDEVVTNVVIGPSRRQGSRSPILPILLLLLLLAGGLWLWRGFLSQPDDAEQSLRDLAIGEMTAVPETIPQGEGDGQPGIAVVVANATETPVPVSTPVAEVTNSVPGKGISLPAVPTASAEASTGNAVLAADCTSPEWWVPYTVQAADTLASLAQIRGLTEDDVLVGNCLANGELTTGQIVLLPPMAVVIGISPVAISAPPTRGSTAVATGSTATSTPRATAPSTATPITVTPLPTSFPTSDSPGGVATSQPVNPTATPVPPVRATHTATPPALGPTATPEEPRPTVTPPNVVPTSTPPPTSTFERPTQTPPPVKP